MCVCTCNNVCVCVHIHVYVCIKEYLHYVHTSPLYHLFSSGHGVRLPKQCEDGGCGCELSATSVLPIGPTHTTHNTPSTISYVCISYISCPGMLQQKYSAD